MSGREPSEKVESSPEQTANAARRPYYAPKLRHLGSVRELTFGSGKKASDGGGLPTGAMGIM